MKLKYRAIERFRGKYSVEAMCEVFGASRSGYYAWRKRQGKEAKDQWLVDLIVHCQELCKQTYGIRRVRRWIQRQAGKTVNLKAVLRIMRKLNLLSVVRRRRSYRRYVQPLLEGGFSYCLFDPQITWHGEVLRLLRKIFSDHEEGDVSQLHTLRLLLEMWELIVSHVEISPASGSSRRTGEQARLQMMLQFIQDHYREPITLQRIADSVYISKSSALQIFHKGIHQSPVAYLINYRLNCAAQQLRTTERTVAAIAADTGFSSAGYFCRRFRELYGVTPQQYRSC